MLLLMLASLLISLATLMSGDLTSVLLLLLVGGAAPEEVDVVALLLIVVVRLGTVVTISAGLFSLSNPSGSAALPSIALEDVKVDDGRSKAAVSVVSAVLAAVEGAPKLALVLVPLSPPLLLMTLVIFGDDVGDNTFGNPGNVCDLFLSSISLSLPQRPLLVTVAPKGGGATLVVVEVGDAVADDCCDGLLSLLLLLLL